jgi:hypothetical protein
MADPREKLTKVRTVPECVVTAPNVSRKSDGALEYPAEAENILGPVADELMSARTNESAVMSTT